MANYRCCALLVRWPDGTLERHDIPLAAGIELPVLHIGDAAMPADEPTPLTAGGELLGHLVVHRAGPLPEWMVARYMRFDNRVILQLFGGRHG